LLLLPAAHASVSAVAWSAGTRADNSHFVIKLGSELDLTLSASASAPDAFVVIEPVGGLPRGAVLATETPGTASRATFRWTPDQTGRYTLRFHAANGPAVTPVVTYVVDVEPNTLYPRSYGLTDRKTAHWAMVVRQVGVHAEPRASSPLVSKLVTTTSDGAQNLVLVLEGLDRSTTETWYRVRLPVLPNNSTGWVPASALGKLAVVHTHLYIDLARLRATLERDGKPVFTTRIGVGRSYWPTPRGQFYIRSRLTSFGDPFYGPVAFGTSARSNVLTDWPGGGFIGVHGTSLPELLPGRVSHGCIRVRNAAILRLAALMKIGTPLTIR
jgi:hypothetical protein